MNSELFQALRLKMENKQPDVPVDEKGYTDLQKGYVGILLLLSTVKACEFNKQCAYAVEYGRLLHNVINPSKKIHLLLIERELECVLKHYLADIETLLSGDKPILSGHLLLADVNRASCEYDIARVEDFKQLLMEICI
jgi:hypothetical protein